MGVATWRHTQTSNLKEVEMHKTAWFNMRITPNTKRLLQQLARRLHMSSSCLVRQWIWHEAERLGLADTEQTEPHYRIESVTE